MDNLPDWVVTIIAIAVGLSPGLAILSARSIARLLHRALWPRPEGAPRSGRELAREELAGVSGWRALGRGVDRSSASVLNRSSPAPMAIRGRRST
jgi:hypothetical protein